jgi:uncharacterized protein YidB (DUF937 family)
MTALLAVLAIAGYQHRDKLAEMLGGARTRPTGLPNEAGRLGGAAAQDQSGGGGIGETIAGALQDLLDRFRQTGHGDTAESWVRTGPNSPCDARQLEEAVGAETLDALARQTGLSRQEIIARLCRELPDAVDQYTPDGRLPAA